MTGRDSSDLVVKGETAKWDLNFNLESSVLIHHSHSKFENFRKI
jgi:hypothetical protein